MADLANVAAAVSAGYAIETQGMGSGGVGFETNLIKQLRGETGEDVSYLRAYGYSINSQAEADANALASLNAERSNRYGFQEPTVPSTDDEGAAQVVDAT